MLLTFACTLSLTTLSADDIRDRKQEIEEFWAKWSERFENYAHTYGDYGKALPNINDICLEFGAPATNDFLEEISKTGLRMDQVYFYIGCDHPNGASFELLRYGVKGISTHFDIVMKIIDGFYEEQDGDPEVDSEEEKIMRARLTAAVTIIKRDQRNVLEEIDHQKRFTQKLMDTDPAFRQGTRAREQALLDLKNLDILKADLEYTVETYPIALLGDNVPMHYALAGGPHDPR
ncbi:MAG: hypothetical protein AAGA96_14725 [Verrucomicrobiota bacterium]